jgi:hypothetical protein
MFALLCERRLTTLSLPLSIYKIIGIKLTPLPQAQLADIDQLSFGLDT